MKFSKIGLGLLMMLFLSFNTTHAQDDHEAFKAALDACATETGVSKPERGVRPSQEDMEKMDACLSAKGIEKPARPQGSREGGGGRPRGPRSSAQ